MTDSNRRRPRWRSVCAVGLALLAAVSLSASAVTTPVGEKGGGATGEEIVGATSRAAVKTTATPAVSDRSAFDRSSDSTTTARSGEEFDLTVFRDIAGQVATEDGVVAVRGTATGTDRVLVALFDRRGRVATELLSVGDDGGFEEDDLRLVTADGTPLAEGLVVATVLSPGRDGRVGDGSLGDFAGADLGDLEGFLRTLSDERFGDGGVGRTQRQLLELYYDRTVEDAGSDDLLLVEEFVYTDGRTGIERIVPASRATGDDDRGEAGGGTADGEEAGRPSTAEAVRVGETMVVQGLTNRRPEDTTVFVTVVDGPSAGEFDLYATQSWGTDGVWRVDIDTAGVEPGVYTVEADDGDSSDRFAVRVLPRATATAAAVGPTAAPERRRRRRAPTTRRRGGNERPTRRPPTVTVVSPKLTLHPSEVHRKADDNVI